MDRLNYEIRLWVPIEGSSILAQTVNGDDQRSNQF